MTRDFWSRVICEHCGRSTSAESAFERWMRGHEDLDSIRNAVVRFDLDILLHLYREYADAKASREIQHMMFIEVKTHMAEPSPAQADTLYTLNQVLRNRRANRYSAPPRQSTGGMQKAYSLKARREVRLRLYGGHLLQLSHTSPDNSELMLWDKQHRINIGQLVGLLRFDLDPDCPNRRQDIRRRSRPYATMPRLFPDGV